MAQENKTQPNAAKVADYIAAIPDDQRRREVQTIVDLMADVTGAEATMWGTAIIGFGSYHYKYDSGREGDSMRIGLSSRKQAITIYGLVLYDATSDNNALLESLGPHTTGKGCLYIKSLAGIDQDVLRKMIHNAFTTEHPAEA